MRRFVRQRRNSSGMWSRDADNDRHMTKYGHRLLAGRRLPHLCSDSLLPYAGRFLELSCFMVAFSILDLGAGPINDVILFLPHNLLWLTCLFLLPNISDLSVSVFCC